jgi:uncharacterized membrane protein YbhN (UPF0104 family)
MALTRRCPLDCLLALLMRNYWQLAFIIQSHLILSLKVLSATLVDMSAASIKRTMRSLASNRKVKNGLIIFVLLATVAVFVHFFINHPDYIRDLARTNPGWIIAVIILNIPMVGLLVFIYDACLKLCGKRLGLRENFLLTSYSSIINFFGPLQSGPGVRAAYLKTRHKVRLRDYTLATLLYYGLFAFFSALFLLIGARPWWQTTLALIAVVVLSTMVIKCFVQRDKHPDQSHFKLERSLVTRLTALTFLQVLLCAITYFVELKAVNSHITWGQAMSYTGAANFALFVSLTPDAIGFREAFLVFSQRIHHVSTENILAANIIDRGAYLIFLILLSLVVAAMHAKQRLNLSALPAEK